MLLTWLLWKFRFFAVFLLWPSKTEPIPRMVEAKVSQYFLMTTDSAATCLLQYVSPLLATLLSFKEYWLEFIAVIAGVCCRYCKVLVIIIVAVLLLYLVNHTIFSSLLLLIFHQAFCEEAKKYYRWFYCNPTYSHYPIFLQSQRLSWRLFMHAWKWINQRNDCGVQRKCDDLCFYWRVRKLPKTENNTRE